MKKTLLSLALMIGATCAYADQVTFDFTGDEAYGMTLLSGNTGDYNPDPYTLEDGIVSIELKGGTRWWSNNGGNELRFYKTSSFTVSVPGDALINEIVLTGKTGSFALASGESGSYSNGTWEGSAKSVTINCTVSKGNAGLSSIEVVYTAGDAPAIMPVRFSVAAGEVIEGTEVELSCASEGAEIYYTLDGTDPTKSSTLYAEPIVINEDLTIKAVAYVGEDASDIATAEYTVLALTSLADVLDLEQDETFAMGSNLIVVYVNGSNYFVVDEENAEVGSMIYKYGLELAPGDVILKGWKGKVDFYHQLFELVPTSALEISDVAADIPAPRTITAASEVTEALVNNIVVLKNVNFTTATPEEKVNFEGTIDGEPINFRNNYLLEPVGAGNYDVTAVVSRYEDDLQVIPISYAKAGSSAVEAIEAEGAVEYFNLQGMRIDNPSNGIIIVRSGKTTKKVLVK